MAAIVCHGLQSCLESQIVETRTLRLNFPFSNPHTPQLNPIDLSLKTSLWESEEKQRKTESSGWSFLQALSNVSHGESLEKEMAYVHPQVKKSSVAMSEKSLELCTEKLGNETGSDIVENGSGIDELLCSSPTRRDREERKARVQGCLGGRKMRTQNFPPPLTTIRGSENMRVRRTHREDGRLVMEVVRVPPSASCFQAERSHGRLRLCFLKNCSFDQKDKDALTNEDEGEYSCDCDGGDMKREKYERPSRCKDGGDHENNDLLINWGVAIS
ncbi:protein FANTASTIC FOUR 3 [Senna tora]|uniref:Protein FANTASTIC FOUR 3 n=1 Tax=Senna tora TaxID=362788 RepID=A0A834W965_9FABA|nr:protein FANTASTIC FOUR 3 [Senna tora]